ncbi:PAAR domain-containing protein [Streptomyces sp. NRRL S-350]|uniref:PAAR domain-containing protein n=1 Tax=Streptomyces sp. NRRL S-350 TaxID=1463902 RepID=UPI0004C2A3FA|nr:PAAR domain-containing protein [Streptomyces sp. NRRL S-350]
MPPAARTGDLTDHGGALTTPPPGALKVATVLIGGRPAAVVGSLHVCVPHAEMGPANLVEPSLGTATRGMVLIGGLPAARVEDKTTCGATITSGALNVLIGGVI